jgi:hypothetical protein
MQNVNVWIRQTIMILLAALSAGTKTNFELKVLNENFE